MITKYTLILWIIGIVGALTVLENAANSTTQPLKTTTTVANSTPIPTIMPRSTDLHFPVKNEKCTGAKAICNDNTCSYATQRKNTCTNNGGVSVWYP